MLYITLPHMDDQVSVFDLCQAHLQLESDYNRGGWLHERPSNQRRREATSLQLGRIGFSPGMRWVNILAFEEEPDSGDEDVRDIYLINVLKLGLPIDEEMRNYMSLRYVREFLDQFPAWRSL